MSQKSWQALQKQDTRLLVGALLYRATTTRFRTAALPKTRPTISLILQVSTGITSVVNAGGTNTITVTRTYNANNYNLYFVLGEGESITDTSLLQGNADDGWYIIVTYGHRLAHCQQRRKQATISAGWQIGSTGINAETVFNYTENQNASAVFNEKKAMPFAFMQTAERFRNQATFHLMATYFTGEVPYGTNLGDMVSSTIEAGIVSREGYEIESLNYVVQTQTADGLVYELKVEISDDTIFNTTFFTDFKF